MLVPRGHCQLGEFGLKIDPNYWHIENYKIWWQESSPSRASKFCQNLHLVPRELTSTVTLIHDITVWLTIARPGVSWLGWFQSKWRAALQNCVHKNAWCIPGSSLEMYFWQCQVASGDIVLAALQWLDCEINLVIYRETYMTAQNCLIVTRPPNFLDEVHQAHRPFKYIPWYCARGLPLEHLTSYFLCIAKSQ